MASRDKSDPRNKIRAVEVPAEDSTAAQMLPSDGTVATEGQTIPTEDGAKRKKRYRYNVRSVKRRRVRIFETRERKRKPPGYETPPEREVTEEEAAATALYSLLKGLGDLTLIVETRCLGVVEFSDEENEKENEEESEEESEKESDDEPWTPTQLADEKLPGYEEAMETLGHHGQPTDDEENPEALVEGGIAAATEAAILWELGYGVDSDDEEFNPLTEDDIRDNEDFKVILAVRNIVMEEVLLPSSSLYDRMGSDFFTAHRKRACPFIGLLPPRQAE